jgi:hypothetical protein
MRPLFFVSVSLLLALAEECLGFSGGLLAIWFAPRSLVPSQLDIKAVENYSAFDAEQVIRAVLSAVNPRAQNQY